MSEPADRTRASAPVPDVDPAAERPGREPGAPAVVEVDGVPVLLAPADGPQVTGGIVFRVGTADETVPTAGITHLVEHLAVATVYTGSAHENGVTAATTTTFHATGSVGEVVRFLAGVCAALRDLPLQRLEQEKQIIRTEGARRQGVPPLRSTRYGARGHGLGGVEELGMHRLSGPDVTAWSRTWFTRGNAVAFLTVATLPEDLDLSLPDGPRRPDPPADEIVVETPACISSGVNGIALEGIVERSTAAMVVAPLVKRRLFDTLRQEAGLSYVTDASYGGRDATSATLGLFADARPDTVVQMSELFLRVVTGLVDEDVSADELQRAAADVRRELEQATPAQLLPSSALAVLHGRDPQTAAGLVAEVDRVTPGDVRRVVRQAWETALVDCDPAAAPVVAAAGVPLAQAAGRPPLRRATPYQRTGRPGEVMLIGDEGVTHQEGGTQHTVLFDEAPALLCWPDGGRALVAPNGSAVLIEPTLYSGLKGTKLASLVDERMDPARLVPLPAREPEAIPKIDRRQGVQLFGLIILLSLSIPLLVAAVVAGVTDGLGTGLGVAVLGSPFWIATAWLLTARRRRRRGR